VRAAIFLSCLWHLFWISSVNIVSLPTKVHYPRFANVSFVGSLLDEPSFEVHLFQGPLFREQSMLFQKKIHHLPLRSFPETTSDLLKVVLPYTRTSWGIPGEWLGLKKKNPVSFLKENERVKTESLKLEGPAASRVLYYRPPDPKLPRWIDPHETGSNLKLRFWVSPRGKVVGIEKVTSSGEPMLDMIGMRYLRRWQFNPKTTEQEERGTITLHFPFSSGERSP